MTTQEKFDILRSADPNTMWGFAVQRSLKKFDDDLDPLIESLRSQWTDCPSVLQECFSKPLNALFDVN